MQNTLTHLTLKYGLLYLDKTAVSRMVNTWMTILIWDTDTDRGFFMSSRNPQHWWTNRRVHLKRKVGSKDLHRYKLFYSPIPNRGVIAYAKGLNRQLKNSGNLLPSAVISETPISLPDYKVFHIHCNAFPGTNIQRIVLTRANITSDDIIASTVNALNDIQETDAKTTLGRSAKYLAQIKHTAFVASDFTCALIDIVPDYVLGQKIKRDIMQEQIKSNTRVLFF